MNYRCLTCGFSQDFAPTSENVGVHHPWMAGLPVNQCPACTKYLQTHGGRKNGKIQMPDISDAGVLVEETVEIKANLDEMHEDWCALQNGDAAKKDEVRSKYEGKKLFGFSPSEVEQL